MATPRKTVFAVVRKAAGKEWIDISSLSGEREYTEKQAKKDDAALPGWALSNPVVRVGTFELKEVR